MASCGPPGQSFCTLHDYQMPNSTDALLVNSTDISRIVKQQVAPKHAAGYKPGEIKLLALLDEPGWGWPDATPPVRSSSIVWRRWKAYLQRNGMTPALLGASSWNEVLPCGRADAGAVLTGVESA